MKELIAGFIQQLKNATKIAADFSFTPKSGVKINNVLICGLGGSGIGGSIVSNMLSKTSPININVHKDYGIPAFVNESTLVICNSYSGNTEETIDAFHAAMKKNAQLCIISSGGTLIELAKANNLPYIQIPGGQAPRANLGYSFTQILRVLAQFNITHTDYLNEINKAADLLAQEQENIILQSEQTAKAIKGLIPIIYCESTLESTAIRWRQQLNENSKMLCWHHVIPEMNHNELVGWTEVQKNKIVVFLRSSYESKRSKARMDLVDEIVSKYASTIHIQAKGESLLEQIIYLVHYGDWLSYLLSEIRNVDADEIRVIDYLKSKLAEI